VRVIVFGSRGHCSDAEYYTLELVLGDYGPFTEVAHGDCPKSPDQLGKRYAEQYGLLEAPYPAEWDRYGRKAGAIRNAQMAKGGADLAVGIWDGKSPGSLNMIREALKAGIEVLLIPCAS
jgi:hypothetical protein